MTMKEVMENIDWHKCPIGSECKSNHEKIKIEQVRQEERMNSLIHDIKDTKKTTHEIKQNLEELKSRHEKMSAKFTFWNALLFVGLSSIVGLFFKLIYEIAKGH